MKLKKILLLSLLSIASVAPSIAGDKYCGCSEGKVSYSWSVPDGKACSSATGKAIKTVWIDLENQELSVVDASEAVRFC